MATYLYCVLAPPEIDRLPGGLTGIGGAPIRALVSEGARSIEAWVATLDDAVLRVTGRALTVQALLHNEIVTAALTTGRTPAPARYGSRYPDDAACIADLGRRASALITLLDQVAGMVEISVLLVPIQPPLPRASDVRPASDAPEAGRRYLEALRARTRAEERHRAAAAAAADRVRDALARLVADEVQQLTPTGVLSMAHLVRREQVAEYRRALQAVMPGDDFRLVVGEARAPYSFASRKGTLAGHDSGSPIRSADG